MDDTEKQSIREAFSRSVNLSPKELAEWLESPQSKSVGWVREGEDEAVGHRSGRRIVEIARKRPSDLTAEDYHHMRKVVGYVRRHLAQGGPKVDVATSRWRYSLMNWGHDPLR